MRFTTAFYNRCVIAEEVVEAQVGRDDLIVADCYLLAHSDFRFKG